MEEDGRRWKKMEEDDGRRWNMEYERRKMQFGRFRCNIENERWNMAVGKWKNEDI